MGRSSKGRRNQRASQSTVDVSSYLDLDTQRKGRIHKTKTSQGSRKKPAANKGEAKISLKSSSKHEKGDGHHIAQNVSSKIWRKISKLINIRKTEQSQNHRYPSFDSFFKGLRSQVAWQNSQLCLAFSFLFLKATMGAHDQLLNIGNNIKSFLEEKIKEAQMQSNGAKILDKWRNQLRLARVFYDGEAEPNWEEAEQISKDLYRRTQKNRPSKIFEALKEMENQINHSEGYHNTFEDERERSDESTSR